MINGALPRPWCKVPVPAAFFICTMPKRNTVDSLFCIQLAEPVFRSEDSDVSLLVTPCALIVMLKRVIKLPGSIVIKKHTPHATRAPDKCEWPKRETPCV